MDRKKYNFNKHEDVFLVILKYFDGEVLLIKENIINDLKNDKYRGETIKPIDTTIIKDLHKIRKARDKGNIDFINPVWANDKKIVDEKMKTMFPDKEPEEPKEPKVSDKKPDEPKEPKEPDKNPDKKPEEPKEPTKIPSKKKSEPKESTIKPLQKKDEYKYILEQRKAYVNWINSEFYDKIIDESDDPNVKNNYQLFIKGYLSIESPFRGLLVYHGLGTGKTATSVITAEGLSPLPIKTFLPASLEGNYIAEIKKFASDTLI